MSNTLKKRNHISSLLVLLAGLLWLCGCERFSTDIPTTPTTLEGLIEEGLEAYAAGDFETAITRFNGALERDVDPEKALLAYQGLGWSYSRINKPALSLSNFNFILSVETVRTGKDPIVELEKTAVSDPYNPTPTTEDTFGLGPWTIGLDTTVYLLSISEISSYSAQAKQTFQVGPSNNKIEPGASVLLLDRSLISNPAGTGIGSPLSAAIEFTAAANVEADSLVNPVGDPDEIATYSDYYLDAAKGEVIIKPRYWQISNLGVEFKYFEKDYVIRSFDFQEIALGEELVEGDDFPVLDEMVYAGGDEYLISGEFFDTDQGGSYYQADAYAGMAAAYINQEKYEESIKAARTALLINEYLKDDDPDNYPYQRKLFEGDEDVGVWELYYLLATGFAYLGDYAHALQSLQYLSAAGATLPDPESNLFVFELIDALGKLQKPTGWQPPQIW